MICFDCNLPDPYNGQGDGIGSCDCPRCGRCGEPPGLCPSVCGDDDYPWPEWDEDEDDRQVRNPPLTVELPAGDVT